MRADGGGPADTRTMGIVHSALRRDLERTRVALSTAPYPEGAQRRAIAEHLLAMMHFLHVHHHGEDEGLWPMVQRRDPSTVGLVERMERRPRADRPGDLRRWRRPRPATARARWAGRPC